MPRWRGRLSHLCCHPREYLDWSWAIYRIFLERKHVHRLLRKSECRGLITKTHIDQRQISNEGIVIRLFFEERFQFATRLAKTFLGSGMVASDLLCPA